MRPGSEEGPVLGRRGSPLLLFHLCPIGRADKPAKEFNQSIDLYSEAIALNPKDSTSWNNRGMSKSRMEEHGAAIADASTCPLFRAECILII